MQTGKLIASIAAGTVVALLVIPQTRKLLYNAACSVSDSLKGIADNAISAVEKGSDQLDKLSERASDVAGSMKETKNAWQ